MFLIYCTCMIFFYEVLIFFETIFLYEKVISIKSISVISAICNVKDKPFKIMQK